MHSLALGAADPRVARFPRLPASGATWTRLRLGDDQRDADYFSRTIVKEPGRTAGRTTHPEFKVALQRGPIGSGQDAVLGVETTPIGRTG
jgi:hypothetical protein